jgi:hypothetical protein
MANSYRRHPGRDSPQSEPDGPPVEGWRNPKLQNHKLETRLGDCLVGWRKLRKLLLLLRFVRLARSLFGWMFRLFASALQFKVRK